MAVLTDLDRNKTTVPINWWTITESNINSVASQILGSVIFNMMAAAPNMAIVWMKLMMVPLNSTESMIFLNWTGVALSRLRIGEKKSFPKFSKLNDAPKIWNDTANPTINT